MPFISLNSNIASARTQRRLAASSRDLRATFERLSSGLRINRASDDAAGLALAAGLNVDRRVYSQGVRNANDALSVLSIAEGAVGELSNVLIRLRELATSSANGTLNLSQRKALDTEAFALTSEFNRIVNTVNFNNKLVITAGSEDLLVQVGYGTNGQLAVSPGDGLEHVVGTGVLNAATNIDGFNGRGVATADLNGDGSLDIVVSGDNGLRSYLNDGTGTFVAQDTDATYTTGDVQLADIDNDGVLDAVATDPNLTRVIYYRGTGGGNFAAPTTLTTSAGPTNIELVDVNGDGLVDIVNTALSGGALDILINAGSGTFQPKTSYAVASNLEGLSVGDFNGDGAVDIVATAADKAYVYLNNGTGAFTFGSSVDVGAQTAAVAVGDVNHDGYLDFVSGGGGANQGTIVLGNGDGTFQTAQNFAPGGDPQDLMLVDMNGDGYLDVVTAATSGDAMNISLGNGDGTFQNRVPVASGNDPERIAIGDFDGDGVPDVIGANSGDSTVNIFTQQSTQTVEIGRINLLSQADALDSMQTIDEMLLRIRDELGRLGSGQSRLVVAINNLLQSAENLGSAQSRIEDADVAYESGELVRNNILQQAGSAILGQANQLPALALLLLRSQ